MRGANKRVLSIRSTNAFAVSEVNSGEYAKDFLSYGNNNYVRMFDCS